MSAGQLNVDATAQGAVDTSSNITTHVKTATSES